MAQKPYLSFEMQPNAGMQYMYNTYGKCFHYTYNISDILHIVASNNDKIQFLGRMSDIEVN